MNRFPSPRGPNPFRDLEQAGMGHMLGARRQLAMGDEGLMSLVSEIARMKMPRARMAHPFLPTPSQGELQGELNIGQALYADGSPAALAQMLLDAVTGHMLVVGTTGAGKTSTVLHVVGQLIGMGIPCLIFDAETDEYYRRLAPVLTPDRLLYFDTKTMPRSPLEPLGSEELFDALGRVADILAEAFQWGEGAKNFFIEAVTSLIEANGTVPTMAEVLYRIETMRVRFGPRLQEYRASVVNRLLPALKVLDGYDCRAAGDFRIDRLLASGKSVIFRLHGSTAHKNLALKDILSSVHAVLEDQPSDHLRYAVVIDEAHEFLGTGHNREWEPTLIRLAATFRKRGVGLVFATQSPSQLPPEISSVVGTRIALRIVGGPATRWLAESMGLRDGEQWDYLQSLPPRTAVVHYPQWPSPFLVEVPTLAFREGAPAPSEWMRDALAKMSFTPGSAEGKDGSGPDQSSPDERMGLPVGKDGPARRGRLSKELLDYLELIEKYPLMGATERDLMAGLTEEGKRRISNDKGNKLRGALEELGMVRVHRVSTGRRGGTLALTELSGTALAELEEMGIKVAHVRGRGGLVHKWHQHEVARLMQERGWSAEVESGEARADVALEREGHRVAVEICLTTERHEPVNIERDLAEGFSEVWVVAVEPEVLERAEQEARRQGQRARFILFSQLASPNATTKKRNAGAEGHNPAGPGRTQGVVREGNERKQGKRSNEGRNRNRNEVRVQVQDALRVIVDPLVLDESRLAQHPTIEKMGRELFTGRTAWRGLALQAILRQIAAKVARDCGEEKLAQFMVGYAEGESVAAIARRIGVSREYASRTLRSEVIRLISSEIELLVGVN